MTETLEEIFRRSSPTLVASLTRAVGPSRLELVESVVQEAFLRAMEEWKGRAPNNPAGWLLAVARNLALDDLRRERTFRGKEDRIIQFVEAASTEAFRAPAAALKGELADDQLTMIFVACHPCNSVPSQIALALRTLCALEIPAIARALFSSEDAIEKRLVLARRRIREENVSFELPSQGELGERLDAVLRVLYLLFNEAYWGTSGPDIVQEDVAAEAIRLVAFLAEHPTTRRPRVLALLALMHFHASRFPARIDGDGNLVTLGDQDRSLWNQEHIDHGMRCLAASAEGDDASPYHSRPTGMPTPASRTERGRARHSSARASVRPTRTSSATSTGGSRDDGFHGSILFTREASTALAERPLHPHDERARRRRTLRLEKSAISRRSQPTFRFN
jgi:predicted RNA polymerase sigma factor